MSHLLLKSALLGNAKLNRPLADFLNFESLKEFRYYQFLKV